MADRLRRIGRGLVDAVLPPRCLACGEIVEEPDALCGRCWGGIAFFAPPWCAGCGLPFAHPAGDEAICADCARGRRAWDRARAVLRYDRNSRGLILGLKHADQTHLAGAFGRWMHRVGGEVLADADLLVPVPLHWTPPAAAPLQPGGAAGARDPGRGRTAGCRRLAGAPPQNPVARAYGAGRARAERGRRLCPRRPGAFAVGRPCELAGRRVVVVDDVLTTGATSTNAPACSNAPARPRVDVLTLARALRTGA